MNTAQVIPFKFESKEVRAYSDDAGEPWFCAADLCSVLGYRNAPDAIGKHCREAGIAKRDISSGGQKRSVLFVNEGNLYRLIIKSRKEEAQRFEAWVCDEVLPAIRRTGQYHDSSNKMATLVDALIGMTEVNVLKGLIRDKAKVVPLEKRRSFQQCMHNRLHTRFNVPRIELIQAGEFEAACNFVAAYALEGEWLPAPGATLSEADWQNLNALVVHMQWLRSIYSEYGLFNHFAQVGSPVGAKLHDHVVGGAAVAMALQGQHSARLRLVSSR